MFRTIRLAGLVSAFAALAPPAQAVVLFDQTLQGDGFITVIDSVQGADDFFSGDVTLTGGTFVGAYARDLDGNPFFTPASTLDFEIFLDDGGMPGATLHSGVLTGIVDDGDFTPAGTTSTFEVFRFVFPQPLGVPAGIHWFALGPGSDRVFWPAGPGLGANLVELKVGGPFKPGLAYGFSLEGSLGLPEPDPDPPTFTPIPPGSAEVPAPAAAPLLLLGLGALGLARRRR